MTQTIYLSSLTSGSTPGVATALCIVQDNGVSGDCTLMCSWYSQHMLLPLSLMLQVTSGKQADPSGSAQLEVISASYYEVISHSNAMAIIGSFRRSHMVAWWVKGPPTNKRGCLISDSFSLFFPPPPPPLFPLPFFNCTVGRAWACTHAQAIAEGVACNTCRDRHPEAMVIPYRHVEPKGWIRVASWEWNFSPAAAGM